MSTVMNGRICNIYFCIAVALLKPSNTFKVLGNNIRQQKTKKLNNHLINCVL